MPYTAATVVGTENAVLSVPALNKHACKIICQPDKALRIMGRVAIQQRSQPVSKLQHVPLVAICLAHTLVSLREACFPGRVLVL
jgi:hypothetical protein